MRQNISTFLLMHVLINICSGVFDDETRYMKYFEIKCMTIFESNSLHSEDQAVETSRFDSLSSLELTYLKNDSNGRRLGVQNCILKPGFFKSLNIKRLTSFVLHNDTHNTVLQNESFTGACELKIVNLNYNSLEIIEPFAFSCLKDIRALTLSYNKIKCIPNETFREMKHLQQLDIDNNRFQTLPEGIFFELISLKIFNLQSNEITNLQAFTFKHFIFSYQVILTTLNLRQNNIEDLNLDFIWCIGDIINLDISSNKLKDIGEAFAYKRKMETLDISENEGLILHSNTLSGSLNLRTLSLRKCNIAALPEGLFADTRSLSELFLSHNQLKIITAETFSGLKTLKIIDLSYNYITEIQFDIFLNVSNVTELKIGLEYNQVKRIHIGSTQSNRSEFRKFDFKVQFNLTENPFECDCHAYELYSYMKNDLKPHIKFSNSLKCEYPENNRGKNIIFLDPKDFICNITEYCPESCICIRRESDNTNIMNCSNTCYSNLPTKAPYNTSILDISHNNLTSLLDLNQTIWENLTEVHAECNQIVSTDLYLPKNVKILKLHQNNLKEIPCAIIKHSAVVKDIEITLANNSWQCDCSILTFQKWLSNHIRQVIDVSDIYCSFSNNSISTSSLIKLKEADICFDFPYFQYVISPGFTVLLVFTLILYYKYKIYILSYLFTHCNTCYMLFSCNRQIDEDKPFDGFISYSSKDREVTMSILEELETKPPYHKFCIHERNWLPGRFITTNIVDSVQLSRKTLIILSEAFIKSEWFHLEFQAAYYQTLQDKMDRIIIILKGDLPSLKELDSDVQHVISTKTYLEWGERWFWEKLRYSFHHQNAFTGRKMRFNVERFVDWFKKKEISEQPEINLREVV